MLSKEYPKQKFLESPLVLKNIYSDKILNKIYFLLIFLIFSWNSFNSEHIPYAITEHWQEKAGS